MRNRTYGGVRGRKTKVGRKLSFSSYSILCNFIPTFAKDNLSVNKLSFIVNIQLE